MNKRNEEPIIFLSTNTFRYAVLFCSENSLISKLLMSGTWRWLSLGRVAGKVSRTVLRHHKKRLTETMEGFRSGNKEPQSGLGRRYVHCHFLIVIFSRWRKSSPSDVRLVNVHSYQTKTKQNKKHFLSFLHRQNYLHTAACYIFSLRRTDPCHPCKTFRWKDFLISSRLSMGSWTNSCVPLFFSWNCRPRKREAPFE